MLLARPSHLALGWEEGEEGEKWVWMPRPVALLWEDVAEELGPETRETPPSC